MRQRLNVYKPKTFRWLAWGSHGIPFTGETRHWFQVGNWAVEWFTGNPAVDVSGIARSSDPGDSARHRLLD